MSLMSLLSSITSESEESEYEQIVSEEMKARCSILSEMEYIVRSEIIRIEQIQLLKILKSSICGTRAANGVVINPMSHVYTGSSSKPKRSSIRSIESRLSVSSGSSSPVPIDCLRQSPTNFAEGAFGERSPSSSGDEHKLVRECTLPLSVPVRFDGLRVVWYLNYEDSINRKEHWGKIMKDAPVKHMIAVDIKSKFGRDAADPNGWVGKTEHFEWLDDIYIEVREWYQQLSDTEATERHNLMSWFDLNNPLDMVDWFISGNLGYCYGY